MPGRMIEDLPNPALSSDGTVLSGAKLYFYRNLTTTLQAVYKDPDLTIPHTNPVVADSAGRFLDVWAANGTEYTVVWKNAGGETLRTFDHIKPLLDEALNGGLAGGTANTITVDIPDLVYNDGQIVTFIAAADNTGATTLNGKDIYKNTAGGPAALDGGEIITGNQVVVSYNATGGRFHLVGQILPQSTGTIDATITTDEDDWHPTGLGTAECIRVTSTGVNDITGIDAPASDGVQVLLENVGTDAFLILAENAGSAAENRFAIPSNITVVAKETATFRYDLTSARWRLIARGFSGASYNYQKIIANGTWTVPGSVTPTTPVKFRIVAGGSGGGGAATNDGAVGSGGGSGGYGEATFTGFTSAQNVTVAIGVAGAAGANTGGNGGAGGSTTLTYATQMFFGAVTGNVGQGSTTASNKAGADPGTATITIGVSGLTEGYSFLGGAQMSGHAIASFASGYGGSNPLGSGGNARYAAGVGQVGVGFGAGGSGGYRDGGANIAGGAGLAGVVEVEWWS